MPDLLVFRALPLIVMNTRICSSTIVRSNFYIILTMKTAELFYLVKRILAAAK